MGKKDKNKKKGKGAEKTAAKTEKKLSNKQKKELAALGEENIESIIAQIEREEHERVKTTEKVVEPPSRRINFSFISHPDKDELILFGGEFFNGQKTFIYNDLFFYNISSSTWTLLKAPAGPPPRCGHQMVATSANKGELWLFGGEFASPTQSQFYHYRDLWVYHMNSKQWEKITAPNGPSARSGHRMVYVRKQLMVFGGFHDNLRDYKYFNDVYCFNTESYKWVKVEASGTAPAPRSGCCMVPLADGKVLVYGGYSKERIKKDVDKGHVFTDAFLLVPDKNDTTGTKWKWVQAKLGGFHFSPRCSMPITSSPNNTAYCFGGVLDDEEDEDLSGNFFNDCYCLDLEKLTWKCITVSGKKDGESKSRRRRKQDNENAEEDEENMEVEEVKEAVEKTTIADDGVFKITLGPSKSETGTALSKETDGPKVFQPAKRMNCGLAVKRGCLFLYGGMFEDGDREITYADMYSLDLKKLEEWRTIIADDTSNQEWLGSDSEEDSGESGSDDEEGSEEEEEDEDMQTE